MDREKVIKGLETCIPMKYETNEEKECRHEQCPYGRENYKPMNGCFWDLMSDTLALLKEQEELIKAMKRDLDVVRSCKVCGNWTECTPNAPPESEEFKMWRDCGGSCKLNWTWRGV